MTEKQKQRLARREGLREWILNHNENQAVHIAGDLARAIDEITEDMASAEARVEKLIEAVRLLGNHSPCCDCNCMDYKGIAREALEETRDGNGAH